MVAANAPWLELLGYQSEKELLAVPFMDLCDEGDQPMLKGALVACLREKWDGSTIKIRGLRANGDVTPIGVTLERILIDEDGKLREEWRKVKVKGHADEVFEAVRSLK